MTKASLVLVTLLLAPATAAAQGYDSPPPGYAPPGYAPPGYAPPGYAPPGYAQAPLAAPPAPRLQGFVLSLALGYAPAWGDADKDTAGNGEAMTDVVSSHIPLIVGAGYRFTPLVSAGAIFQYGFAQLGSGVCPSGVSCSASDIRLGAEVRLHFMAEQSFSPWISGGLGYEWFGIDMSQGSQSAHVTFKGIEFLNLEAGGDFRAGPAFTLGPFIGFRVQRFDSMSGTTASGQDMSQDIPSENQAIHGWIAFGIRGALTL